VKAPAPGARRGYDAAKKTVGRKRHIVVDTDGRLLMLNLTSADLSDSAGAQMILDAIRKRPTAFCASASAGPRLCSTGSPPNFGAIHKLSANQRCASAKPGSRAMALR
jgi:hypothetical protein